MLNFGEFMPMKETTLSRNYT